MPLRIRYLKLYEGRRCAGAASRKRTSSEPSFFAAETIPGGAPKVSSARLPARGLLLSLAPRGPGLSWFSGACEKKPRTRPPANTQLPNGRTPQGDPRSRAGASSVSSEAYKFSDNSMAASSRSEGATCVQNSRSSASASACDRAIVHVPRRRRRCARAAESTAGTLSRDIRAMRPCSERLTPPASKAESSAWARAPRSA